MSPPILRKELERHIYVYGKSSLLEKDLCENHSELYWNMVLYFSLIKLPSYFLDPNISDEDVETQIITALRKMK
jgi:hypothetical protein